MTLRAARPDDAEALLAIYAPVVIQTAISFEYEPPSVDEMARRVRTKNEHPWIVDERDGTIVGYAYASRFRERDAYDWCTETTVYVAASARRGGVARGLYRALLSLLGLQGFTMAYAGIALPNDASVRLHEAMGFVHAGTLARAGLKLGKWHDLGFWQRELAPAAEAAARPRSAAVVAATDAWRATLAR